MDDRSQTITIPSNREKDHAQVLGMLNSVELQKQLEDAREKRERILAARAADAKAEPLSSFQAAVASEDEATEKNEAPERGALPLTLIPDDMAAARPAKAAAVLATTLSKDEADRRTALLPSKKTNRTPPVLRAPPRLVGPDPTRTVQHLGLTPAHRRKIRTSDMVLGLVFGIFAGVGVTWVLGTTQRGLSDTTATASVASEPAAAPIVAIDADPPMTARLDGSAALDAAPVSTGRSVVPKARPTQRVDDPALPDRVVAEANAARPEFRGSVDDKRLPPERQRTGAVPDIAAPLPRIDITETLRAANQSREATVPDRSAEVPARPAKAVARPVLPGIIVGDAETRPMAATPDVAAAASGVRMRTVVHIPPAFPRDVLASVRGALGAAGANLADTRTVGISVSRNQVRYFHARDAADAARIAQAIGTAARDFTDYRPSPSVGTLEVWLAD